MLDTRSAAPDPRVSPAAAAVDRRTRLGAAGDAGGRSWGGTAALAGLAAVAAAVGVGVVWAVFVSTRTGQAVDELAFNGALIGSWLVADGATDLLDLVSLGAIALAIAVVAGIALARRRWWLAAVGPAVIAGANVTTQVLKSWVLTRPDLVPWVDSSAGNSLPSGHVTVAASITAALVLVAPPVARRVVATLGAVGVTAFGVATLVGQWHRPSDVVAAVLVALAWAFAAAGVVSLLERSRREGAGVGTGRVRVPIPVLGFALLAGGIVALLATAQAGSLDDPAWGTRALAYLGAVSGIAGIALAGTSALASVAARVDGAPGPRRGARAVSRAASPTAVVTHPVAAVYPVSSMRP